MVVAKEDQSEQDWDHIWVNEEIDICFQDEDGNPLGEQGQCIDIYIPKPKDSK